MVASRSEAHSDTAFATRSAYFTKVSASSKTLVHSCIGFFAIAPVKTF